MAWINCTFPNESAVAILSEAIAIHGGECVASINLVRRQARRVNAAVVCGDGTPDKGSTAARIGVGADGRQWPCEDVLRASIKVRRP